MSKKKNRPRVTIVGKPDLRVWFTHKPDKRLAVVGGQPDVGDIIEREGETGVITLYQIVTVRIPTDGQKKRMGWDYICDIVNYLKKTENEFRRTREAYDSNYFSYGELRDVWNLISAARTPLSFREIKKIQGFGSTSKVHAIIKYLEDAGFVKKEYGTSRTIRPVIRLVTMGVDEIYWNPKRKERVHNK
jgi:hypothetical protein